MTRPIAFWITICALALVLVVLAFWFDPAVRSWVVEHQNRGLRNAMANVSRFGDWPEHVLVGAGLLAIAWWRRSRQWSRIFLAMLVACALAGATARAIKIVTGRARPSVSTEAVWSGPRLSEKYHAFPSGHTAASSAFFAVLVIASWRIGLITILIPLAIGFSRMYVAAHYLSDVVCAGIVGISCALLITRLMLPKSTDAASAVPCAIFI